MNSLMAKNRLWITVEEKIKRAFEAQASAMGMTSGDLLTKIVREDYADTLAHIERLMEIHSEEPTPRKKK